MHIKWMTTLLLGIFFCQGYSYGQSIDSITDKLTSFPTKFLSRIRGKTADLDRQLTRQTEKYLQKLAKREAELEKKLEKQGYAGHTLPSMDSSNRRTDSAATKNLFDHTSEKYAALIQKLKNDTGSAHLSISGEYLPYIDSLKGTLSFLNKNPQLISSSKLIPADVQSSLMQLQQLQAKMQDADLAKQFMQQRKEQIRQYLSNYTDLPPGINDSYNAYNKQLYYYGQQVKEYKDMLNDPDKLFRTALALLDKLPAFSSFMRSNSFLSGAFNMPGSAGSAGQTMQGLQTRDQVMSVLQNQFGPGGPNAESLVRSNIQSAQGQLDQLKNKLSSGGGGAEPDMPDFKPNGQKTKTFLQRLEYGTNLQSVHGNYYFPTTTDLGLSVDYKLTDKNTIGVGASYKIGWGNDISHVNVSSQGAGLRSFADIQMKKSWFASGGFEYNYQQPFYSFQVVNNLSNWQQSGLLGVSKIVSMKTKVFKNTKFQLLWDFLSYQQVPKGQPLKFRLGYSF